MSVFAPMPMPDEWKLQSCKVWMGPRYTVASNVDTSVAFYLTTSLC